MGPPAVGKMTVGMSIAQRTGLRLFHNHQTIDLVLPFFAFGTPPYSSLWVSSSPHAQKLPPAIIPGLIFTYCEHSTTQRIPPRWNAGEHISQTWRRRVFYYLDLPHKRSDCGPTNAPTVERQTVKRDLARHANSFSSWILSTSSTCGRARAVATTGARQTDLLPRWGRTRNGYFGLPPYSNVAVT